MNLRLLTASKETLTLLLLSILVAGCLGAAPDRRESPGAVEGQVAELLRVRITDPGCFT